MQPYYESDTVTGPDKHMDNRERIIAYPLTTV